MFSGPSRFRIRRARRRVTPIAATFLAHDLGRGLGYAVNLSTVFAGQNVGVKQVDDRIWLVSFMNYDLGCFDDETCRLEPIENPFGAKVLPMPPE